MKRNILFIAMGALVLLSACTKKPWASVEEGSWNNDRRILDIKFAGQAGLAKVKDIDASTGLVTVSLATNLVADMSRVAVETLELSYKATSSIQRGGTLDFTDTAPVIEVTSATGIKRTYTIEMKEFTETIIGKYAFQTIRIWGGTGPEWGGGALMDPSTKSWCWYSDEGYGPEAEYDDYLEFTMDEIMADGNTTGKCIHYGGANGKHWNCLFKAAQNKEGDTDIDLHNFYRQIPVGESTWVRDYVNNTISFTDANGKVTTGEIYPAGEYQIYKDDTRDVKAAVPNMAFVFKLTGVDDWTNIYNDYDKFVKRPRLYMIAVEPVAEIPAASKTEGTEGKNTVEPPAPAPAFALEGDWKVKELWVYGGCNGGLGRDKAETKTWDWNNIGNELDNILTFTPSAEGSLSGSVVYTPGADGKYWDYRWVGKKGDVNVNEDVSRIYSWLPHAASGYVYDPEDKSQSEGGVVSIKNGPLTYAANLLLPGSYVFLGLNPLVIADGSMALALQVGSTPSTNTSYIWKDYDKFVNSPLIYIMVFTKQVPNE